MGLLPIAILVAVLLIFLVPLLLFRDLLQKGCFQLLLLLSLR